MSQTQVTQRVLARVARAAVAANALTPTSVRFVRQLLDATFRVVCDDHTVVAVKVGGDWYRNDPDAMRSEVELIGHLHEHRLCVPRPLHAGVRIVEDPHAGPIPCAVLTWMPGRKASRMTSARAYALGAYLARLHELSDALDEPGWFRRKPWTVDTMTGYWNPGPHPIDDLLTSKDAGEIEFWRERLHELVAEHRDAGLINGDFRPGNVLWHRNEPCLVDFNDTGYGPRAYDVCYLQGFVEAMPGGDGLADAVSVGYASVRPLPYGTGPAFRAAELIRMARWRAARPGGAEGGRLARMLLNRLHALTTSS